MRSREGLFSIFFSVSLTENRRSKKRTNKLCPFSRIPISLDYKGAGCPSITRTDQLLSRFHFRYPKCCSPRSGSVSYSSRRGYVPVFGAGGDEEKKKPHSSKLAILTSWPSPALPQTPLPLPQRVNSTLSGRTIHSPAQRDDK